MSAVLSGPMFEPKKSEMYVSLRDKEGAHYNIYEVKSDSAMEALREMFPDGEANELNFCLFSTSGVHGTYASIEDAEESFGKGDGCNDVTFLIVQPRIVCTRYGNCTPKTPEDFAFLKKLRASSWKAVKTIGAA